MVDIKSKADFYKQLKVADDKVIMLEFYTSWCSLCEDINKTVNLLSRKYRNLIVLKIDLDKFEYIAERYKVESMPDFVFIQNYRKLAHIPCPDEETLATMMSIFGK